MGEEVSKMEDKAEHDADYERSVEGDLGEPSVQQNQLCWSGRTFIGYTFNNLTLFCSCGNDGTYLF